MIRTRVMACAAALLAVTATTTVTTTTGATAAADPGPVRLILPEPSGPHRIGTVSLHLVDESRKDPWVASVPKRELMVGLWYPAREVGRYPVAPWMPGAAATRYLRDIGVPPGKVLLGDTHAHEGAPVDRRAGRLPVVLYSPGANASRSFGTGVVEELASRGYLVVTIDHTYDAAVVQFPGDRVAVNPDGEITDFGGAVKVRVDDTRFVLDRLAALQAGRNPDAGHRALPRGLSGGLDLKRIGMFGHSLGGAATASAMFADRRIRAGMGLDGAASGPVVEAGLDRPYMVVDTPGKGGMAANPVLRRFWLHLRGWRLNLTLKGAAHNSFGDDARLIPLVAPLLGLSPKQLEEMVGTIPAARALAFQRAYPRAFFDLHLRGRGHLLDRSSPRFPEVTYTR
ncbi:alpha/beta hydrolase family protein [Streptosporangium sp. NPDC004631]